MSSRNVVAFAIALAIGSAYAAPASAAKFALLTYHPRTEARIVCPANLECDVTLEPGESVHDGFAAAADEWDPHATYTGPRGAATPHLVFRPSRPGLHTNVIVPTSRRTYYLDLTSTTSREARYYTFAFPRVFVSRSVVSHDAHAAGTSPAAAVAAPAPSSPPDPTAACVEAISHYSFHVDRALPNDHATGAKPSLADFPALWTPRKVCTDGRHTFVEFPATPVIPDDTPVVQTIGADGDTVTNYTYDAHERRIRVDGVPEYVLLELGSQANPLRLILHHDFDANAFASGSKP